METILEVLNSAAEQGIAEEEATGMGIEPKEFVEKRPEDCAKA